MSIFKMAAGKFEPPDAEISHKQSQNKKEASSPLRTREENQSLDSTDSVFYFIELTLVVISLTTWVIDILTDFLVAFGYFNSGNTKWGALTLVLVFLPSVIVQVFSVRWYASDGKMDGWQPWLVHICMLQPLERYLLVLVAGWRAYKSQNLEEIESYYHQQNDVCMLRLFEAFLESAPQLTLQVYIMVATSSATWLTGVSACMSLVALGWAVTAYNHALRKAYRENYTIFWPSLCLQTLWHISMVASRVAALVLFTSLYKAWVYLVLGVHWLLMTIWVVLQDTDFGSNGLEERFFNCVVGVIYCFCFFSLKEGATRWRVTFFYSVMLIEGSIMVGVWFPFTQSHDWHHYTLFVLVFAAFFFGVCCMLLYYRCCHPSGPIYCFESNESSSESLHPKYPSHLKTPPRLPPHVSRTSHLRVDLVSKQTSHTMLPRRSMLLKAKSKVNVEYQEVATPSQFHPVREVMCMPSPHAYDQTFEMADTPGFHHYSVNASACLETSSACNTLSYTGVNLSCMTPPLPNKTCLQPRQLVIYDISNKEIVKTNSMEDGQMRHNSLLHSQNVQAYDIDSHCRNILPPSTYFPEDKVSGEEQRGQRSFSTSPETETESCPSSDTGYSSRDMYSTPRIDRRLQLPPAPDFTPIHPSVTPYLRTSRGINRDSRDMDFAPNCVQCDGTASLDISLYDTFSTCEEDSYYETCDELDNRKKANVNTKFTTDTGYATTDTEYPANTDTNT